MKSYHLVDYHPKSDLPYHQYRAVASGEYRPPKKGEWYISGAIAGAYMASNDLKQSFHIAKIVLMRRVEYWEVVDATV